MKKIVFLIDGFNIYHSILALHQGQDAKWLNLSSICFSYLHLFGKKSKLESIYYFSALPNFLRSKKPAKIERHKNYITCLRSTGVQIEFGRFKRKQLTCPKCHKDIIKHEEKETDVAIAIKLFEIFMTNICDIAVLVTGDTDLAPAVRKAKDLFPDKKVVFAFPFKRYNRELQKIAPGSFHISYDQYIKHQFSNPVVLENGQKVYKPDSW